jgi:nitrite reductase/ring-hydroxylating ferredoxin subunit
MATRAPFLSTPYSGYLHNEVPKEDEELTHVGPRTPGGEYLRRFWHPVIRSDALKDLPVRLRILGEDLVVFRDKRGRVGLLELHCPHRGTSLEFGLICETGIRCCYHFWHFDVDGRILETPGEPADSTLKDRLYHGAYPIRESNGLVFAYMGPADKMPALPILDTFDTPGCRMVPTVPHIFDCNWVQCQENVMDPAHLEFLHAIEGSQFIDELKVQSVLDWMDSPSGIICTATRRVEDKIWLRMNEYLPPNLRQFGGSNRSVREVHIARARTTTWSVPLDDTHTMIIGFRRIGENEEPPTKPGFGQTADRSYEERQRVPGDYDAQTSQRAIAVHALEHLGATDRGVIMTRNIIRRGIQAVQRGEDPQHVIWKEGQVVPTFANHTVILAPPTAPEADEQFIKETGRKLAEGYLKDPASLVDSP